MADFRALPHSGTADWEPGAIAVRPTIGHLGEGSDDLRNRPISAAITSGTSGVARQSGKMVNDTCPSAVWLAE